MVLRSDGAAGSGADAAAERLQVRDVHCAVILGLWRGDGTSLCLWHCSHPRVGMVLQQSSRQSATWTSPHPRESGRIVSCLFNNAPWLASTCMLCSVFVFYGYEP